jgi:hypothetical protein
MSSFQRFLLAILPSSIGKAMEQQSRLWMYRCGECGYEISVWGAGGIRYKAAGRPRRYRRCDKCGQASWQEVSKKE